MADRKDEPAKGERKKPGKGPGKKVILIACGGAVLLLAAGAAGFFFLNVRKNGGDASSRAESELKREKAPPPTTNKQEGASGEAPSNVLKFDMPFFVTLADTKYHKVLQFYLTVEFNDPSFADIVRKNVDKFRDVVYTEVSTRTRAEVASLEGKERLRRDLINAFDGLLQKPGAVRGIYFPDYVLPL